MRNIENVVSDVQDEITSNHFSIQGTVGHTQGGWTVVKFTSPQGDVLDIEVHLEDQNTCVINMSGFTYDQRNLIMTLFIRKAFD